MFNIHVGGPLELFTTIYGWALYTNFFQLLSITGVFYFPFILGLFNIWKSVSETGNEAAATVGAQRQVLFDVLAKALVFMMCVLPAVPLTADRISHVKTCSTAGGGQHTSNPMTANANTRYGSNLRPGGANGANGLGQAYIPIFWQMILSVSGGVNHAASATIPCLADIRALDKNLREVEIDDPAIKQEYQRFARECFLPAKSRYQLAMDEKVNPQFNSHVQQSWNAFLAGGGNRDDINYIGSNFFMTYSGFYFYGTQYTAQTCMTTTPGNTCSFQAEMPVPGWPYVAHRDTPDLPGRPYCDEWWNGTNQQLSLRNKLLNNAQIQNPELVDWNNQQNVVQNLRTLTQRGESWVRMVGSDDDADEILVRSIARNNFVDMDDGSDATGTGYATAAGAGALAVGAVFSPAIAGASVLTAKEFATSMANFYMTMWALKQAAPKIQAVLLMAIYALMIFYLVMSNYEIENVIIMMFVIFGLRFFTPLWTIMDYLDESLFAAMYFNEDDGSWSISRLIDQVGSVLTMGTDRLFLDMTLTAMYLLVPAILFGIMAMAGVKAGQLAGQMDVMNNRVGGVGKIGGGSINRYGSLGKKAK